MLRSEKLPFINTTQMSIEEIGTTIMHRAGLRRNI
jgi:regulator of PEP synthase PpsR (kinase-PPPase family)